MITICILFVSSILRFVWKICSIQFTCRLLLVNTGASLTLISFNSTYIWLNVSFWWKFLSALDIWDRFLSVECWIILKGDLTIHYGWLTKLASFFSFSSNDAVFVHKFHFFFFICGSRVQISQHSLHMDVRCTPSLYNNFTKVNLQIQH